MSCALWSGRIIGPILLGNDTDNVLTTNGERYRIKITKFFLRQLEYIDL